MSKPSHATVVAYLALFIALGGTSYAAVQLKRNSVRSGHIKNGQVKRADLARGAVNGTKVADGTLSKADFAAGQLPAGPKGDKGDKGDTGPAGAAGEAGAAGATGVIAHSRMWSGATVALTKDATSSQVNLLNARTPGETTGVLTVDRPGQLHAVADAVVLRKTSGAGGRAVCALRVNGQGLSNGSYGSFADGGLDTQENPQLPVVTLSMTGAMDVEPGTYNVGVLCVTDRDDLAELRGVDLNVVVFAK